MTRFAAFLRGINVGGNTRVEMPALKTALEESGFTGVKTWLNSGNVVLGSVSGPEETARLVELAVLKVSGFSVPVQVRTRAELEGILARDPLDTEEYPDLSKRLVYLLDRNLDTATFMASLQVPRVTEACFPQGRELYIYYPQGIGRSLLTTAWIDRKGGVVSTGRNRKTLEAVLGLL